MEQFLLFSTIFAIYLKLQGSQYIFICKIWLFHLFFLDSANLICRGTVSGSFLGLPDHENRLYMFSVRTEVFYLISETPLWSTHNHKRCNKKKQSKGLNGDLKPEHKKTTNTTPMGTIAHIDSHANHLKPIDTLHTTNGFAFNHVKPRKNYFFWVKPSCPETDQPSSNSSGKHSYQP